MLTLTQIVQVVAALIVWAILNHINSEPVSENDPDINTYIPNCFNN